MTKNSIVYKKLYILKLFLNVVTAGIEGLVISGIKFLYACIKEVCRLWAQLRFDIFHELLTTVEARQIEHNSSSWNVRCCKFQFAHVGICWGLRTRTSLHSNLTSPHLTSLFLTSGLPYARKSLCSECFPSRVNAVMRKWREYCISDVPSLRARVLCRSLHLQMQACTWLFYSVNPGVYSVKCWRFFWHQLVTCPGIRDK
jgi:hypothetical protein